MPGMDARALISRLLTRRSSATIRRLVPILGLAALLGSPASAQNPGALHWRQKTGLGVMLAGVVAIGVAHERHAPDPLRRLRPIGGGLVAAGTVVALLPVPEPVRPEVAVTPAGWAVGKTWSWGAAGRVKHRTAALNRQKRTGVALRPPMWRVGRAGAHAGPTGRATPGATRRPGPETGRLPGGALVVPLTPP